MKEKNENSSWRNPKDIIDYWYGQPMIQYNIFKCLKDRYMTIKPNQDRILVRYNKITSYGIIYNVLRKWNTQKDHKLYMDITTWKSMPLFSYNTGGTRQEQQKTFNNDFEKNVMDVDLVIDIDAEKKDGKKVNLLGTIERAKKCRAFLRKYNLEFSVWNSSSNGFQFFVTGEEFRKKLKKSTRKPIKKVEEYIKFVKKMKGVYPDFAVYDLRRIIKLPYSLCDGVVVMPLDDSQLDRFDPMDYTPSQVLQDFQLRNRGLRCRK
tara:strand:+ start:857 stop:1645 length:789 start_codon:yes stop_codon:yes gene_type:complete